MNYVGTDLKVVGTRPIRPDGVDKVTGRAKFGADMVMPGMLWGKVKRSPHAHARIVSIDTSEGAGAAGRARRSSPRADFPDIPSEEAFVGEGPMNFRDLSRNCMARGKVLYEGHAVAAVAATSPAIAEEALDLIEVEVRGAAARHRCRGRRWRPTRRCCTTTSSPQGVEPKPTKPSNIAKRVTFTKGDVDAGFKEAEVIDRAAATRPSRCTRPISSRMPASCSIGADGQCTIFSSSQGQFMVRAYCAKLLGIDIANIRAIAGRDRRRVRRQDAGLSGAGGAGAVEEDRPPGQDA